MIGPTEPQCQNHGDMETKQLTRSRSLAASSRTYSMVVTSYWKDILLSTNVQMTLFARPVTWKDILSVCAENSRGGLNMAYSASSAITPWYPFSQQKPITCVNVVMYLMNDG